MMFRRFKERFVENMWIIATVIGCIFPFGIIFSVWCTVYEVRHSMKVNKTILHCAIGAMIFAVVMTGAILFSSFTGNLDTYGLVVIYIPSWIQAIYLFCVYLPHFRRAKQMEQCLFLIQTEHITSISQIAEIIGVKNGKVISAIQRLSKLGILDGTQVAKEQDEILFTKSVWAKQKVVCKSCGANLVVNFGQTLVCEYCNGALEATVAR